jgi:hypothetical protein
LAKEAAGFFRDPSSDYGKMPAEQPALPAWRVRITRRRTGILPTLTMQNSDEIKLVKNQIDIVRRASRYGQTGEWPWSPDPLEPPDDDAD